MVRAFFNRSMPSRASALGSALRCRAGALVADRVVGLLGQAETSVKGAVDVLTSMALIPTYIPFTSGLAR
jgi:hypothetical protein